MKIQLFFVSCVLFFAGCQNDRSSERAEKTIQEKQTKQQVTDSRTEVYEEEPASSDLTELDEEGSDTTAIGDSTFADVDWKTFEEEMTKDFSFVILISTKSYAAALERAEEASKKLNYPLNLRGLHENNEIGLSFSRKVCEEEICGGGLHYPIYIPRSDWGDSKYISIEYSDAFEGFTKGYYIVIAASGEKGAPAVNESLEESREFYKDAYAKTCGVWVGCGC